jgi:hypothetical protein
MGVSVLRSTKILVSFALVGIVGLVPSPAAAVVPTVTNTGEVGVSGSGGVNSVTFRLGSLSCNPEGSGSCTGGASGAYTGDLNGGSASEIIWRYRVGADGVWQQVTKDCLRTPEGSLSTWCGSNWHYSSLVLTDLTAGVPVYAQPALKNSDGQSIWLNASSSSGMPASATPIADSVVSHIWSANKNPTRRANSGMSGDVHEFKAADISTSVSGVFSKYEWDFDNDGTFEISSTSNTIHTKTWDVIGTYTVTLRLTSQGGETDTDTRTFEIYKKPPAGEVGISILEGAAYTNNKVAKLKLVWPEYAVEARVSNDGGFSSSKTKTIALGESIDWELDDSVAGIFTKVVYVRFNGDVDTTKTYSDDIILDTTAPTIESSTAQANGESLALSLKASDDITGVDKVQIKTESATVTQNYSSLLSVPASDLGLIVTSSSVKKMSSGAIQVRISDKAGNWTRWRSLTVAGLKSDSSAASTSNGAPVVGSQPASSSGGAGVAGSEPTGVSAGPAVAGSKPVLAVGSNAQLSALAANAKLAVAKGSRITVLVAKTSRKTCRPLGNVLVGLKSGTCRVTITVKPKNGRAVSKTLTLKL